MTAFLPASLHAQLVSGVVVDPGNLPIPGVLVTVIDSSATFSARALTDDRGTFRVRVPGAGTYRLHTLRIGFRPVSSERFAVGTSGETTRRVVVTSVPVALAALRIEGRSSCRVGGDSATTTFAALEQARAALTAAGLTDRERTLSVTTVTYSRTLDPASSRVLDQTARVSTESVRQPWRTIAPDSARRAGYVVTDRAGATTYSAPGLESLASTEFLEDHCFRLVPGPDRSRIGIAFTPTPARQRARLPEIRGTLWLDRATAELRAVDLGYVNLPPVQARYAAGALELARLPTGAWVITRWSLRLPELEARARPPRVGGLDTTVVRIRVFGGDVALATRGGDTLWARAPVTLAGTVRDSASDAPVGAAEVEVAGTGRAARTDGGGRFRIAGLLPGRYTVRVRTPALDSLATAHQVPLELIDGGAPLELRVPSAAQWLSALCGRAARGSASGGVLVGTVRMRDDTPPPPSRTRVIVEWSAPTEPPAGSRASVEREVSRMGAWADASGTFRVCGVRVGLALVVRGETEAGVYAEPRQARITPGERVASVRLVLDPSNAGLAALDGTVVTDSVRRPVEGAEVTLPELERGALTDARGRFRLTGIPPGRHRVRVRRLGYGPLDTTLTFAANRAVDRSIVLSRVVTLDSVNVIAKQPDLPRSFLEHQRVGLGHFLTREQLAKQEGRKMSEVMRELPGVNVLAGGANKAWLTSSRGVRSLSRPCGGPQKELEGAMPSDGVKCGCMAQVYLDGVNVSKTVIPDINRFAVDQLEAVEYYAGPAQVPDEYRTLDSQCGVLVLWTRRSP